MTAGDIALLIGAVAGLVTAVGAFVTGWQRKAARDADQLEKERNGLRKRTEVLLRHVFVLRQLLAQHGIEAPPMPEELDVTETPL